MEQLGQDLKHRYSAILSVIPNTDIPTKPIDIKVIKMAVTRLPTIQLDPAPLIQIDNQMNQLVLDFESRVQNLELAYSNKVQALARKYQTKLQKLRDSSEKEAQVEKKLLTML